MAGFLLAASLAHHFTIGRLAAVLIGSSLVIACGCVTNNYIDRNIDAKMARTKQRALVTAAISVRNALTYAIVLGLVGFSTLLLFVNAVTAAVGAVGLFFYLVPYSIYKRRSPVGTIVGSVSGATPIVAGYTAATGRLDGAAVLLFLAIVCWQMPHFYAIAMYRLNDYKRAGIPVLPAVKGMRTTKIYILGFTAAFTIAAVSLSIFGYTGYLYAAVMGLLGLVWLQRGLSGFTSKDDTAWGKGMFLFSLVALLSFCSAISLGALLP